MLRLTLAPGVGPVLLGRMLERFGSPQGVIAASATELETIRGIGPAKSASIVRSINEAGAAVEAEIVRVEDAGVRLVALGSADYPPLLARIPDPPPLIYVRGALYPQREDRFPLAIAGSRQCTTYGIEQAGRFARAAAGAGLTVVSGGARGVDTAAHRGAIDGGGRTIAVLGCGLAHYYPPENSSLFDRIISEGRGAVISELPMTTPPKSENFPARNRIISGLALGVLIIEAGEGSGALITARLAADEHGREVMVLPGRVDSPSSRGSNGILKEGCGMLVTEPGDVLQLLESAARHQHLGTHEARFTPLPHAGARPGSPEHDLGQIELFDGGLPTTEAQRKVLSALDMPRTADQLVSLTALNPGVLRAELTVLEMQRRVVRRGSAFERVQAATRPL